MRLQLCRKHLLSFLGLIRSQVSKNPPTTLGIMGVTEIQAMMVVTATVREVVVVAEEVMEVVLAGVEEEAFNQVVEMVATVIVVMMAAGDNRTLKMIIIGVVHPLAITRAREVAGVVCHPHTAVVVTTRLLTHPRAVNSKSSTTRISSVKTTSPSTD